MIVMKNIQAFCGSDESRPYLNAPFNYNGHTYATDGCILIRLELSDKFADASEAKLAQNIDRLSTMALKKDVVFVPLPELPKEKTSEVTCEECFEGRLHECSECRHTCPACHGGGFVHGDELTSTNVGDGIFALIYLRLVSTLPNAQIERNPPVRDAMNFKFDGGVGLLMPRTKPLVNHVILNFGE